MLGFVSKLTQAHLTIGTPSAYSSMRLLSKQTLVVFNRLIMLWLLFTATSVFADQSEPQPPAEQVFQLDDDLFSDLEPLTLEKPVTPAQTKQSVRADGESRVPTSDKDLDLQRDLSGEDLGGARGRSPLEKVARAMQRVKKRLAMADTAMETQQLQSRIVQDFDELLAQLQKQSQQKSGSPPSSKSPSQGSKPSGQQQGRASAGSKNPANRNSNRRGQAESVSTTQSERDRLWEKVWGDLPATVRQQMQSARPEKFLPKYSRLIEDYFRRLAEDPEQE